MMRSLQLRTLGSTVGFALLAASSGCGHLSGVEKCASVLDTVRVAVAEKATAPTCDEVKHATDLLPVVEAATPLGWEYVGEKQMREELKTKFGIQPADSIMPIGFVERPDHSVLVFGFDLSGVFGKRWPMIALVEALRLHQPEAGKEKEFIISAIGEGGQFGTVSFFKKGPQGALVGSNWLKFTETMQAWPEGAKTPKAAKQCVPCEGWMCTARPAVCWGDYDGSGAPQFAFRACSTDFCGVESARSDANWLAVTLKTTSPGDWQRRGGKSLFVGYPTCEDGLNFCGSKAGCVPGKVFELDPKDHIYRDSPKWQAIVYPVRLQIAPPGCNADREEGVLVMIDDHRFTRYVVKMPEKPKPAKKKKAAKKASRKKSKKKKT